MFSWLVKPVYAQPVNIANEFVPARFFSSLGALINVLLPNIFTITGIIAFVFVIGAGFNFIIHAGEGESEKTSKDKESLTAAIIGLGLIVGAYFIVQIISTVLGYNILNPRLP